MRLTPGAACIATIAKGRPSFFSYARAATSHEMLPTPGASGLRQHNRRSPARCMQTRVVGAFALAPPPGSSYVREWCWDRYGRREGEVEAGSLWHSPRHARHGVRQHCHVQCMAMRKEEEGGGGGCAACEAVTCHGAAVVQNVGLSWSAHLMDMSTFCTRKCQSLYRPWQNVTSVHMPARLTGAKARVAS